MNKEEIRKKVGNKIRTRREELGLSQEQLATRIGYKTRGAVSKLENGDREISFKKMMEISKALKVDEKYFWVGQEPTKVQWSMDDIPNKYKEDLKYNWELTKAEKEELIKEIINKARSRNINIGTIKKNYNLNTFDTKVDTNILYKIAKDYQINSNKGKFLNKIIKKESEIKKWFYNEINSMSDDELIEFKTILEYIKNKNK